MSKLDGRRHSMIEISKAWIVINYLAVSRVKCNQWWRPGSVIKREWKFTSTQIYFDMLSVQYVTYGTFLPESSKLWDKCMNVQGPWMHNDKGIVYAQG